MAFYLKVGIKKQVAVTHEHPSTSLEQRLVVIGKYVIHLVTQYYDTPPGIEEIQVILRSQKTVLFFFNT